MSDNRGRILFVEEDRDMCNLVSILLKYAGYEAVVTPSAAEGLRLAQSERFELILLDWLFEDGEGVTLCQDIRRFDADTPIFFYNGNIYKPQLAAALEAGAQGFFLTPIEIGDGLPKITGKSSKRH